MGPPPARALAFYSSSNAIELSQTVGVWLRRHGKSTRPELTSFQRKEFRECFNLIDGDGSGAVSANELEEAFKALGVIVPRADVEEMVASVDKEGTGQIEYPEFVEIMASKIASYMTMTSDGEAGGAELSHGAEPSPGGKSGHGHGHGKAPLPFQLMATAYQRRKMLEAVMNDEDNMRSKLIAKAEAEEATRLVASSTAHPDGATAGADGAAGGAAAPEEAPLVGGAGSYTEKAAAALASAAAAKAARAPKKVDKGAKAVGFSKPSEPEPEPPEDEEVVANRLRQQRRRRSMAFIDGYPVSEELPKEAAEMVAHLRGKAEARRHAAKIRLATSGADDRALRHFLTGAPHSRGSVADFTAEYIQSPRDELLPNLGVGGASRHPVPVPEDGLISPEPTGQGRPRLLLRKAYDPREAGRMMRDRRPESRYKYTGGEAPVAPALRSPAGSRLPRLVALHERHYDAPAKGLVFLRLLAVRSVRDNVPLTR